MKSIKFSLLVFLLLILSCSKESLEFEPQTLEIEPISEVIEPVEKETPVIKAPTTMPMEPENKSEPMCAFDLRTLTVGEKKMIDCVIDLNGQTINLASDVSLLFGKGDIINGSLNFSGNSKIDSRLLNLGVKINGNVTLLDNDFVFFPTRWNIVEGSTNINNAFQNHKNLQFAVDLIKKLTPSSLFQKTNFNISRMDAYFESNFEAIGIPVVSIPSNFNLIMSDETTLRVFSVNNPKFTSKVIRLVGVSNVSVQGGKIIGDRLERLQPGVGNVLFEIKGGQNITVDNVEMNLGSITGLTINSVGRKGNPIADGTEYFPSKNVIIKNCTFNSNRSNNLSITDGEDITIQNCKLFKAGKNIGGSIGAAPRIGIVVEPVEGQVVERVIITGNEVREGSGISILAAFGNDILITQNTTEGTVGWNGASNIKIINNPSIGGVIAGDDNAFNLSQSTDNEIINNTIRNAPTGILASNDDIIIENNQILNCKVAVQMRNLKDSRFRNNTITSNIEGSFGFNAQIKVDNVEIHNNTVTLVDGRPFDIGGINDDEISQLIIRNNEFNCGKAGRITFSKGINVADNTFKNSGFGITSSKNINVTGNKITNVKDNQNAFFINNSSQISNIRVANNTFESKAERVSNAIRLFAVGDKNALQNTSSNIEITENIFKVAGNNFAVNSSDFNNVAINNNTIITDSSKCCFLDIKFKGNNSLLTGNTNATGSALKRVEIEGTNNQF